MLRNELTEKGLVLNQSALPESIGEKAVQGSPRRVVRHAQQKADMELT